MTRTSPAAQNPQHTARPAHAPESPGSMPAEAMDVDADAGSSEYETDSDAEPEEFYVSLDLTIPTPIHAGPSSNPHTNTAPPSHLPPPRPLSSTTRSGRTGRRPPPAPRPARRAPTSTSPSPSPDAADAADDPALVERWAAGDHARIQILDLHTENPLVSFGNRIWSGSWTAAVGTELFVRCPEGPAPPDDGDGDDDGASQSAAVEGAGAGVGVGVGVGVGGVLATAGARVHCLPAVLTARQRPLAAWAGERTYGWRPGKSSFLERLEEIRVAKGEKAEAEGEGEGSGSAEGAGGESGTEGEGERRGRAVEMGEAFRNRVDAEGEGTGAGQGAGG